MSCGGCRRRNNLIPTAAASALWGAGGCRLRAVSKMRDGWDFGLTPSAQCFSCGRDGLFFLDVEGEGVGAGMVEVDFVVLVDGDHTSFGSHGAVAEVVGVGVADAVVVGGSAEGFVAFEVGEVVVEPRIDGLLY